MTFNSPVLSQDSTNSPVTLLWQNRTMVLQKSWKYSEVWRHGIGKRGTGQIDDYARAPMTSVLRVSGRGHLTCAAPGLLPVSGDGQMTAPAWPNAHRSAPEPPHGRKSVSSKGICNTLLGLAGGRL